MNLNNLLDEVFFLDYISIDLRFEQVRNVSMLAR